MKLASKIENRKSSFNHIHQKVDTIEHVSHPIAFKFCIEVQKSETILSILTFSSCIMKCTIAGIILSSSGLKFRREILFKQKNDKWKS